MSTPLFIGNNYIFLSETASTNSYLQSILREQQLAEGAIVSTGFQSAGRGQMGAVWESSRDQNIMLSVLLFPKFLNAGDQFLLSKAIALAVRDFVFSYLADKQVKIKWPNDILVSGQKICGILIENGLKGEKIDYSIVGIGINVNEKFNDKKRTSIKGMTGLDYDLRYIEKILFSYIEARYLQLRSNEASISADYLESLFGFGEKMLFTDHTKNEDFEGTISDINQDGRLVINTDAGLRLFNMKEVGFTVNS